MDESIKYTYQSSADFINALDFEYVKTYSFRRGKEYEDFLNGIRKEYDRLGNRKRKEGLSPGEADLFKELTEQLQETNYLIGRNGTFHPFSKHTQTFSADSREASKIKEILKTEFVEQLHFMCAPEYRDAIVFYNRSDSIVATINICLSCAYMEVKPFSYLNADVLTYDLLKKFFLQIGHEVEEPDHFFLSEEMKEKRADIIRNRNA